MGSFLTEKQAGYLEGTLLIATPMLKESCFTKSIIYIFAHDENGAMGLVINHIFDNLSYSHVFSQLNITEINPSLELPIHFGGPVETERGFILHTDNVPYGGPTLKEKNGIVLSSNLDLLKDMARGAGPEDVIFALGYAGWQPGQLEKEITENSWLTVPASKDLIFRRSSRSKWLETAEAFGIDIYRVSEFVGHA